MWVRISLAGGIKESEEVCIDVGLMRSTAFQPKCNEGFRKWWAKKAVNFDLPPELTLAKSGLTIHV